MAASDTISGLTAFERRGPGTDSERRAARWLAGELAGARRRVRLETFWCRPNWPVAHAWHVALAVAGSLLSVSSSRVGGALILVALLSVISDELTGYSPGRRLTLEHASQNVVSRPADTNAKPVRLIITANYDAPRTGLAYRDLPRALASPGRKALAPGWLAWLTIGIVWLLVVAILRLEGHRSSAIGVVQLIPTVGLVLAFAALIDIATAGYGPGTNDNASGVAVALAITRALDAAPPANLAVELVLQGAVDHGLTAYLIAHKPDLRPTNTVTLGIAPAGAGRPRWWQSDGRLVPLRYFSRLRQLASDVAEREAQLGPRAPHGRGATPAWPARTRRLPAIAIGCLDDRGLAPRSHQPTDTPEAIDTAALDRAVQFGLMLVDAIDASIADSQTQRPNIATPA